MKKKSMKYKKWTNLQISGNFNTLLLAIVRTSRESVRMEKT